MKYLIVGLGNIGPDYADTRHNIGFSVLDYIAQEKGTTFTPARYGDRAEFRFKGRTFILIKPSTYMNLSGKAVHYWLNKEKIEEDRLLIITDDVALPLGTLRLKAKGGAGGHNGLSNIIDILGTEQFPRLRFGIGDDYSKGAQVHFVLGKWNDDEWTTIKPQLKLCLDMVTGIATIGIERTMNLFNKKPGKKTPQENKASQKPGNPKPEQADKPNNQPEP